MVRFAAAVLVLLALSGCEFDPAREDCGAPGMQDLVGQDDDVLAAMTFPAGTRLIYPGTPVTEDYIPFRLNIDIEQSGRISGVWCG